jgi:hypothetical protein
MGNTLSLLKGIWVGSGAIARGIVGAEEPVYRGARAQASGSPF